MTPLEQDIYGRLALALDHVEGLLGDDLVDTQLKWERIESRARQFAAQLTCDDPSEAAQTAIDLAELVDLDDPTDAASPLGIACALTFEYGFVSQSAAAQLLGVGRARVGQLLATGKLAGDGGVPQMVSRSSIARRLLRSTAAVTDAV